MLSIRLVSFLHDRFSCSGRPVEMPTNGTAYKADPSDVSFVPFHPFHTLPLTIRPGTKQSTIASCLPGQRETKHKGKLETRQLRILQCTATHLDLLFVCGFFLVCQMPFACPLFTFSSCLRVLAFCWLGRQSFQSSLTPSNSPFPCDELTIRLQTCKQQPVT